MSLPILGSNSPAVFRVCWFPSSSIDVYVSLAVLASLYSREILQQQGEGIKVPVQKELRI